MPKPTIAVITANTQVSGVEYSPQSLKFSLQLNKFPSVRVTISRGENGKVSAPLTGEILDRIRGLQEARLAGREEPDLNVVSDDGTDAHMEFNGFLAAPLLDINRVYTADQFSGVGVDAMLDGLDLSIYDAGHTKARQESATGVGPQLDPQPAAKDGDIITLLKDVTDVLVGNYEKLLDGEQMENSKALMQQQHNINQGLPLELWYEILDNSDIKFEHWGDALKSADDIGNRLTESVKGMLITPTPGFWNTMRRLMATFQMYYVPSFDGAGYFARADTKVGEPEGTVEVSASGVSVADGSPRIMQPGGVVMFSSAAKKSRAESSINRPRVMAYYPSPLIPGFIQKEVPPFWLMRATGVPILGSEVDGRNKSTPSSEKNLSLEDYRKRKEESSDFLLGLDASIGGVLTEMCEIMFKELQLAHSSAVLTTPLDYNLNEHMGKRITVNIKGQEGSDGGSFTAFVGGVSHSVDLRQGKSLSSSSNLHCTHVVY